MDLDVLLIAICLLLTVALLPGCAVRQEPPAASCSDDWALQPDGRWVPASRGR